MLLSSRTTQYVEAMVLEGDNFDYCKWIRRVREEEAEARQVTAVFSPGGPAASEIDNLTSTPDCRDVWVNSKPALPAKSIPVPGVVYGSDRKADKENLERSA